MSAATERLSHFVPGREYPSPVTHVIGFDYSDGVTTGVLKTADGSVFRFDMTASEFNPDGLDLRTFELAPLPADVFDRIHSLLNPDRAPLGPVWVPLWKFPTESARQHADAEIDRWLASAGPVCWRVEARDLTGTISAFPIG